MSNTTLSKIDSFLKDKNNQKFHYNFNEELDYKIPSGSLNLDMALGGGLPAGVHRFTGVNEGAKPPVLYLLLKIFKSISEIREWLFI